MVWHLDQEKRNSISEQASNRVNELASYACLRERTGLSDEYKKRVEALTSKKNEIEKKLKRKM